MTYLQARLIIWNPKAYPSWRVREAIQFIVCSDYATAQDKRRAFAFKDWLEDVI